MNRRRGFTLVEMMVSIALSIIIIGMFAALYRWTTDAYSQQKGNRRNDQRSRMLSTIVRSDIQSRTFRHPIPFVPGQLTPGLAERSGYFSVSENNPNDGTDDVLAFTTKTSGQPYQGRATFLFNRSRVDPRTGSPYTDDPTGWARYLQDHPNQPEFDDGNIEPRQIGSSTHAEVVYFMRHGRLIRRTLLIRHPYDDQGAGAHPGDIPAGNYNPLHAHNGSTGPFWRDFDYSAYNKPSGASPGLKFHRTSDSLRNANPPSVIDSDFGFPRFSLGIPALRFGYSLSYSPVLPREYDSSSPRKFIGRFLVRETSHSAFGYPGTSAGDPHTASFTMTNGLVTAYSSGAPSRNHEDVIMENVHEFDVKVWDDTLKSFVDLGNSGPPSGQYHRSKNLRSASVRSGAGPWDWNRFDTWHPYRPSTGNPLGNPPYKAGGTSAAIGSSQESPLRAIQVRIRFYDVPTKKMRQLTIQEALR